MRKYWRLAVPLGALVLAAVLFLAWAIPRTPRVVSVGTRIQHDDFFFTVTHIARQRLSDGTALYHVNVKVQSEAKAVNYNWRDGIAYVRAFDSGGYGHNFYPVTNGSMTLAPGEERTVQLEFRVPPGFSSANIRFWDGIFMGDVSNAGMYGREIVPLEPYHPPFGT